ncbi:MAG: nuclear transport factor 2 family protein [Acidobacteria bacterium]|nr:nuclear transport factor 2 family protein [Acidobacteriota bacterium]
MKRIAAISLLLAGATWAADPKTVDGVTAAEKAWAAATAKADETALNKLLAADLDYVHSNGDADNKTQFIGNMKSGARRYHKVEHEKIDARVYGNTAVVTATARIETSQKGGAPAPAHLRFIHVWVHQKGQWQMVAHQSLRLPN